MATHMLMVVVVVVVVVVVLVWWAKEAKVGVEAKEPGGWCCHSGEAARVQGGGEQVQAGVEQRRPHLHAFPPMHAQGS